MDPAVDVLAELAGGSGDVLRRLALIFNTIMNLTTQEAQMACFRNVAAHGAPSGCFGDCPDWEHNRILDLASAVGAFLIVSADADLTSMSPWRGRPIIEPPQFASLVDAARRTRRRR